MTATRSEVYAAIDGEREYQEGWRDLTLTTSGGQHSLQEFLTYIASYTNEALEFGARRPDPKSNPFQQHALRKIAALAVAALEQHGVLPRAATDNLKERHQ